MFTFNIKDSRIKSIPGVVAQNVSVKVVDSDLESEGPLLITHWGMSAPAILKLSSFGALELAKRDYKFKIDPNTNLFTELNIDSFGNLMIVNAIEDEFSIEVDEEDIEKFATVNEIIDVLQSKYI